MRLWVEIGSIRETRPDSKRQPLREAVSWNVAKQAIQNAITSSASSWGCELKCRLCKRQKSLGVSASSWGCELKYLELYYQPQAFRRQPLREAVSWNVTIRCSYNNVVCQPLREAVSWNVLIALNTVLAVVSLFVRLWVEMSDNWRLRKMTNRQPLREAVSWNNFSLHNGWLSILSASSWGCELKFFGSKRKYH